MNVTMNGHDLREIGADRRNAGGVVMMMTTIVVIATGGEIVIEMKNGMIQVLPDGVTETTIGTVTGVMDDTGIEDDLLMGILI